MFDILFKIIPAYNISKGLNIELRWWDKSEKRALGRLRILHAGVLLMQRVKAGGEDGTEGGVVRGNYLVHKLTHKFSLK